MAFGTLRLTETSSSAGSTNSIAAPVCIAASTSTCAPPPADHVAATDSRERPDRLQRLAQDMQPAIQAGGAAVSNAAKGETAHHALPQRYRLEAVRRNTGRIGNTPTNAQIIDTSGGRVKASTGKPVGTWVIRSDEPHGKVQTHHININEQLTGKTDPHIPISPGSYEAAGTAARVLEGVDKFAVPLAVSIDAARLGSAFAADGGHVGKETLHTGGSVAGGWAGAAAGAAAGAQGGAWAGGGIGSLFAGFGAVPGAAIGAVAGGVVGGVAGAFGGSIAGEHAVDALNR